MTDAPNTSYPTAPVPAKRALVILDEEEPRNRLVPVALQWPRRIECQRCGADISDHTHFYSYRGQLPICFDCTMGMFPRVHRPAGGVW